MKWEKFKGFKRWKFRNMYIHSKRPEEYSDDYNHINSILCCCFYCVGLNYWGNEIKFVELHGRYPYPGELNERK